MFIQIDILAFVAPYPCDTQIYGYNADTTRIHGEISNSSYHFSRLIGRVLQIESFLS